MDKIMSIKHKGLYQGMVVERDATLFEFWNNLTAYLEQSALIHRTSYALAADPPSYVVSLPQNPKPGEIGGLEAAAP
jgi:hypothetical protein